MGKSGKSVLDRWKNGHHLLSEHDEAHGNNSYRHAQNRVSLHGTPPQHAKEKATEQRTVGEGCDRQRDDNDRRSLLPREQGRDEKGSSRERREALGYYE